jgi:hypothetical protein
MSAPPIGPLTGFRVPANMIHRSLSGFGLGRFGLGQDDSGDSGDGGDGGDGGSGTGFQCSGVCPSGQAFDPTACMCQPLPLTGASSGTPGGGTCPSAGTPCTDACGNSSFQDGNCNCIPTTSSCAGSGGSPVGGTPGAPCFQSNNQVGTYNSSGVCAGSGSSLTPAQIAALFQGSAGVLKSLQTPYMISGTGLVYDPATGRFVNSTALTATSIASSLGSLMPMLLIIVAAVVFLPSIGRK